MAKIFCKKHQHEGTQLPTPPLPGALGERIYHEICQEAWSEWLAHQTMLINEYRLNLLDEKAKQFLQQEMIKFLFENNAEKPEGYSAPE